MCSVNFIYHQNHSSSTLHKAIESMVDVSKHRGPDATEVLVKDNFALGFNRLQIVGGDLGSQPIYSEEDGLLLICNGEIFNHQELKENYFPKEKFITTSDVEIILHLYKKFGEKSISYLEGQFSYLLYDLRNKKIILGRDRFGINPLFYYMQNGVFLAASEIKSILASGIAKDIALNKEGVVESLLFYGAVPPKTCFTNVNQVPPANYLVYNISANELTTKKYWEINGPKKFDGDMRASSKKLRELLLKSVKKRLQGESIPGVYLSGGLDSSIIAYIVALLTQNKARFFSIAFDDERYDESAFQEQIAKSLNMPLNQINISFEDIITNLKECIYHVETPLIRTAPVPMMLLSKKVKATGTKFVLCGEGADEMYAGYPVFIKDKSSMEEKWETISKYINIFRDNNLHSYAAKVKSKIIEDTFDQNKLSHNRKKEITTKLSQYLLVNQGDRMSMSNSVEQRFPFLDSEVVNYAFSLDNDLLISEDQGKKVLREAFKNELSIELINRKKRGYLAPDDKVIKNILMESKFDYLLGETYFHKVNIFDYAKTSEIIKKIIKGSAEPFDANALLFVLTTHMLHDFYIENNKN